VGGKNGPKPVEQSRRRHFETKQLIKSDTANQLGQNRLSVLIVCYTKIFTVKNSKKPSIHTHSTHRHTAPHNYFTSFLLHFQYDRI